MYSSSSLEDMLDAARRGKRGKKRKAAGKKRRTPKRDPLTGLFMKTGAKKRGRKRGPGRPKGSKTRRHHADMALLDLAMHHDDAKKRRRRKKKSESLKAVCPPELRAGFAKICKEAAKQEALRKKNELEKKQTMAMRKALEDAITRLGYGYRRPEDIGKPMFSEYDARRSRRRRRRRVSH